ncbi:PREDICTED: enhancer of mRNA-decapping protein 3-like [Priapulus caudatus]|uniref:Enhancer of mRNA-decapping protein 3-like n=1 Tax=Priapulus caudatus TaxID=37621 RepID=A0ABM1DU51_PRICU|nr:PREDICTED: enhancer of mRNA-decapping protein 3-like [Priapulus caudatus]
MATGSSFIGSTVSVDCGSILGTYQGEVCDVGADDQTISLVNAFRNGLKCKISKLTLSAIDIQELSIITSSIEAKSSHGVIGSNRADTAKDGLPPLSRSSLPPAAGSSVPTASSCSSALPSSSKTRNSPAKLSERRRVYSASESTTKRQGTPRKAEHSRRKPNDRNDDCFNQHVCDIIESEFDFEYNLSLFDKAAVFEEINSQLPNEGLRLVECNKRVPKYRHDENVLENVPAVYRQITAPSHPDQEYYTDSGLVIPSISYSLRTRLLSAAEKYGLSVPRQLEMVGRSASEMALQLLGGCHRINPENSHQRPRAAVLCGPHMQGAQGVSCARHLANHNVDVTIFIPNAVKVINWLQEEMNLFKCTSGVHVQNIKEMTSGSVDIIINALDSHDNEQLHAESWYKAVVNWTRSHRASVLSIDPPSYGVAIEAKWSLSIALPLPLQKSVGKIYLCDLGLPARVFTELGIKYESPFGSKFVIPLHSSE